MTNTLNIEWVEDTFGKADAYSQYGFGANKLNVVGRKGDLSFWVRLDARMFSGVEWAPMSWLVLARRVSQKRTFWPLILTPTPRRFIRAELNSSTSSVTGS